MINYAALPAYNAALNAGSALMLMTGFILIRNGRVKAHSVCMVSAFALSSIFLVSYLTYHAHAGVVRYQGQGWIRSLYFAILTTHTILAGLIVPLVLRTLYL